MPGRVLAADDPPGNVLPAKGDEVAENLQLGVAHVAGRECRRRVHRHERQELQHVVLNHVAKGAGMIVKGAATPLHADRLGHGDLHVLDVLPVEQRLENGVAEAEGQEVLDGILPQVMVDAVDLIGAQKTQDVPVELHGALQVETERLFDHHASPRPIDLAIDHSAAGQTFDNAAEILRIGRQVGETVARQPLPGLHFLQPPGKALHAVARR